MWGVVCRIATAGGGTVITLHVFHHPVLSLHCNKPHLGEEYGGLGGWKRGGIRNLNNDHLSLYKIKWCDLVWKDFLAVYFV